MYAHDAMLESARGLRSLDSYLVKGMIPNGMVNLIVGNGRVAHYYWVVQSSRALIEHLFKQGGLHVISPAGNVFLAVTDSMRAFAMGALNSFLEVICAPSWPDAVELFGALPVLLTHSGGTLRIVIALLQEAMHRATGGISSDRRMVEAWCCHSTIIVGLLAFMQQNSPLILNADLVVLESSESQMLEVQPCYKDVISFLRNHRCSVRNVSSTNSSVDTILASFVVFDRALAYVLPTGTLSDAVLDGVPVTFRAALLFMTARRAIALSRVFDQQGNPIVVPARQNYLPEDPLAAMRNGQPEHRRVTPRDLMGIPPRDSAARFHFNCTAAHSHFWPVPATFHAPFPVAVVATTAYTIPALPAQPVVPVGLALVNALAGEVPPLIVQTGAPIVVGQHTDRRVRRRSAVDLQRQAIEVNVVLVQPHVLSDEDRELRDLLTLNFQIGIPALSTFHLIDLEHSHIGSLFISSGFAVTVSSVDLKFDSTFSHDDYSSSNVRILGLARSVAMPAYVSSGQGDDRTNRTLQNRGVSLQLSSRQSSRLMVFNLYHGGAISSTVSSRVSGSMLSVPDIEDVIYRAETDVARLLNYEFVSMLSLFYDSPRSFELLCDPGMAEQFSKVFGTTVDADGFPAMVSGRPYFNARAFPPYRQITLRSILISPTIRSSTPFDLPQLEIAFGARSCTMFGTMRMLYTGTVPFICTLALQQGYWPIINGEATNVKLIVHAGRRGTIVVRPKINYGKDLRSLDFTILAGVFRMWMPLLVDAGFTSA